MSGEYSRMRAAALATELGCAHRAINRCSGLIHGAFPRPLEQLK